jgi:hypothetical protein
MPSPIAKLILSITVVASSTVAAFAQDAVTFRYRFEPGEKLTYDVRRSKVIFRLLSGLNAKLRRSTPMVAPY